MPKINFLSADGTTHQVNVATGLSVMEAAMNNNVPGVTAECGGGLRLRDLPCLCAGRRGPARGRRHGR